MASAIPTSSARRHSFRPSSLLRFGPDAIRAGARFFATNADRYCPVPGGGEPDAAAMIAAIEACTDTRVEAVVGKPSRFMAEAIIGLVGLPPERCLMVGNDTTQDLSAAAIGIETFLVDTWVVEREGGAWDSDHRGDHSALQRFLQARFI